VQTKAAFAPALGGASASATARDTARRLDQTRPATRPLSNSPALTFTTFICEHTINLETHITHHGSGDFPLLFAIAPCKEINNA
jgi:hypothetical protein